MILLSRRTSIVPAMDASRAEIFSYLKYRRKIESPALEELVAILEKFGHVDII